ncbi:MAG: putative thioredoxin [Candidatus Latescibacterota bacterium]|jgi:putative thioredoxin
MDIQPQPQIFDVDESNFEELVLRGSQERVIVVDFWAPWCEPCKTLGPIIEEVVTELGPGIALAKVNIDENPQLATAFRVQSIPSVKVVHEGKLAQEFTGALPKGQIDSILRPLVPDAPKGEANFSEQAQQRAAMGDLDGAAILYKKVIEETPSDGEALLGLARISLQQNNIDAVHEFVNLVEIGTPEYQQAQALLSQIEFAQKCHLAGGKAACAQNVLATPEDLEAQYQLACCQAAEGQFEEALATWFNVVEKKPNFQDGAAKDAMVAVFHLLGRDNELVTSYQRRLYQAMH